MIECGSKTSAEAWLLPADDPTAQPSARAPSRRRPRVHVDHWGDRFVVVTNLDAEDFRVMTAPLDAPGDWTELVAHVAGPAHHRLPSRSPGIW